MKLLFQLILATFWSFNLFLANILILYFLKVFCFFLGVMIWGHQPERGNTDKLYYKACVHVRTFSGLLFPPFALNTERYGVFFFYLGFLSRTFTNRRTAEEGRRHFCNSSLPLPPASQTIRHLCRKSTSANSQQPGSNREPLVSERKSLTTKLRTLRWGISLWSVSPYSLQIWENIDQKISKYGHFSRSKYYKNIVMHQKVFPHI